MSLCDIALTLFLLLKNSLILEFRSLGEMVPPFPIPNREVKRFCADNSFPATGSENRSWPELRNFRRKADWVASNPETNIR